MNYELGVEVSARLDECLDAGDGAAEDQGWFVVSRHL